MNDFRWVFPLWEILQNCFDECICIFSSFCLLEMIAIFLFYEIMIHKIRTETCPESIYFFWIEQVPKWRIHLEFSPKKVEYIEKPIVLIDYHFFFKWYFYESISRRWVFENDWILSFRFYPRIYALDSCIRRNDRNLEFYPICSIIFYQRISQWCDTRSWPIWEKTSIEHFSNFLFSFRDFSFWKLARDEGSWGEQTFSNVFSTEARHERSGEILLWIFS